MTESKNNNKTTSYSVNETFFIKRDNLYIVPICHYQMEFALEVRKAILEVKPDVIAVELPSTFEEIYIKAVKRFPYLSVIFYQTDDGEYIYFPVEPADPLAEAVRTGLEMNIPLRFIDLDTDDYPLIFDPMPDSYAVKTIGLKDYYELYHLAVDLGEKPAKVTPRDEKREEAMAYHLQQMLNENLKILLVTGMTHVSRILKKLDTPCAIPIGKVSRKNLSIFNLSQSSIREVSGEMPFIISAYEMIRGNHDVEKEIEEAQGKTKEEVNQDESSKILSLAEMRKKLHPEPEKIDKIEIDDEVKALHESLKAHHPDNNIVIELPVEPDELGETENSPVKDVKNELKIKGVPVPESNMERDKRIFQDFMRNLVTRLHGLTESKVTTEPPTFQQKKESFEDWLLRLGKTPEIRKEIVHKFKNCEDRHDELLRFFKKLSSENPSIDRQKLILSLLKQTALFYQENVNEEISTWQFNVFATFSRNYARITGRLLPDTYQLITCARSCADDNYAHEVWDLATYYPWTDTSGAFRTIDIHADEVWLFGKKITLRRKFPFYRKRIMKLPFRERKNERKPGEWTEKFDDSMICSYPPEDLSIENFSSFLRKKGMNILSEDRTRVQQFTTSLLDGIDIRETLRNWHEKKIYVREHVKMSGGVGSVVIIFDEDIDNSKFPWKLTWLGEHHQESDMAFYSTRPTDKIVGPGISRCTYGGFMMTYPPGRVFDVWVDPFYSSAQSKSEVLLMSAIEYSNETNIVHIAAKPPRSYFQSFAGRLGKKIIYIPIGSLSPATLRNIRVFHVLAGHKIRELAKEYIW
jgi:hypothetical protein